MNEEKLRDFTASRVAHWNEIARKRRDPSPFGREYYRRLFAIYGQLIPPGLRVLDVGSGSGDLLAALRPSVGLGVDLSPEMVSRARERHPDLRFVVADAHRLGRVEGPFDAIVLSDLLNDVWDVQGALEELQRLCTSATRLVLNVYSHVWEVPLRIAAAGGLARPKLQQNWLTVEDISNLLDLSGFELVSHREEILFPVPIPGLRTLANAVLVKLWPFRYFALTSIVVARPVPRVAADARSTVSVVVPARNEAGNIERIVGEVPEMGGGTELVFVEGHSTDGTFAAIEAAVRAHPERTMRLYRQTGAGKGDAVRLGFEKSTGDIVIILDGDLTVDPGALPRFYEAVRSGRGEFINGVRLVYPMEKQAMRPLNFLGNKFFSLAFSWLLGQPIKDTLCGTKALRREDYARIARNRRYFGDFDPFGDFDLLFGAAKLNLKIVELPVRYGARRYGTTNIRRWRHGWMLLKMVAFAARRIKFV